MQLTPLQSRLVASLLASCALLLIYISLFSPSFALAQEIAQPPLPETAAAVGSLPAEASAQRDDEQADLKPRWSAVEFEDDFAIFDKALLSRAPEGVTPLSNNVPEKSNLEAGTSKVFVFEKASIIGREQRTELRRDLGGTQESPELVGSDAASAGEDGTQQVHKRQEATRTVYISANTCMQPQPQSDATAMDPPQLTIYISSRNPGPNGVAPGSEGDSGTWHVFTEGAVMANVSSSEDVFVQLTAPTLRENSFTGIYNFEVAASIDASYHAYDDRSSKDASSPSSSSAFSPSSADLVWLDSDDSNAVLTTRDLGTKRADGVDGQRPFVVFANRGNDRSISGVRYSFCGLQTYAQIAGTKDGKNSSLVRTSIADGSLGGAPRQQFHLSGLQSGTNYSTILARATRSNAPGGGGLVFRGTSFNTRQDQGSSSCMLISGLDFCSQVAYSVPANRAKFNASQLAITYDNHVKGVYENFEKALAQVQCLTESTSAYSLARTCDDCAAAYKDWLCAVSIPRCEDFASNKTWLHPRNIDDPLPDGRNLTEADLRDVVKEEDRQKKAFTGSRNAFIDEVIAPGPYKELLPCDTLCFDLTQSCAAKLEFRCPTANSRHGYSESYHANETAPGGGFKCNFPLNSHFAQAWARSGAGRSAGAASLSQLLLYGAAAGLGLALM